MITILEEILDIYKSYPHILHISKRTHQLDFVSARELRARARGRRVSLDERVEIRSVCVRVLLIATGAFVIVVAIFNANTIEQQQRMRRKV